MSIDIKNKTIKFVCICSMLFIISNCFCSCKTGNSTNIGKENSGDKLNNEELETDEKQIYSIF